MPRSGLSPDPGPAPVQILTYRLTLRGFLSGDLDAMYVILSDPLAMRFGATLPHASREETTAWLERRMGAAAQLGEDFAIETGGRVIGKAGFARFPELGVLLHPHWWGQGLAREALTAILDRAFRTHGLPSVTATVDTENAASLRLFAGLGFLERARRARTLKLGDSWRDSVDFELTRTGWLRNQAARSRPETAGRPTGDATISQEGSI